MKEVNFQVIKLLVILQLQGIPLLVWVSSALPPTTISIPLRTSPSSFMTLRYVSMAKYLHEPNPFICVLQNHLIICLDPSVNFSSLPMFYFFSHFLSESLHISTSKIIFSYICKKLRLPRARMNSQIL